MNNPIDLTIATTGHFGSLDVGQSKSTGSRSPASTTVTAVIALLATMVVGGGLYSTPDIHASEVGWLSGTLGWLWFGLLFDLYLASRQQAQSAHPQVMVSTSEHHTRRVRTIYEC